MDELLSELDRLGFMDPTAVAEEILNLHIMTGKADRTTRDWQLFVANEPREREMAAVFHEAAAADDPLAVLKSHGRLFVTTLNARLRRQGGAKIHKAKPGSNDESLVKSTTPDADEQSRLRTACEELAHYYDLIAPGPGRPSKEELDAALIELAEIFARHTNHQGPIFALPVTESSRFIQFAELALRHSKFVFQERTRAALSSRWRSLCEEAQKPERDSE